MIKCYTQQISKIDSRTYIGKGKLTEIKTFVKQEKIKLIVFDDQLSASQTRNIEKTVECRVIDRTHLILDIFALRAQTAEAKAQVALAQYNYLLPRLVGMWTHLERQKGGIGMRGPGEREIETDRRVIRSRIKTLTEKISKLQKQRDVQRTRRTRHLNIVLVGYTNAGKSTLMNSLTKAKVYAEDKLFATLDTTTRRIIVGTEVATLSDTVGFIRKLPTELIESFKSTLDEVRHADIVLHVIDICNPDMEEHIGVVNKLLAELECNHKPLLHVFNKIDAYQHYPTDVENAKQMLEFWHRSWCKDIGSDTTFVSAENNVNTRSIFEFIQIQANARSASGV